MDITEIVEEQDPKDIMRLAGGLALITLGAGMILSFPKIRKLLQSGVEAAAKDSEGNVPPAIKGMLPDIERYLKIRSM
jgi:hypothetical protein